MQIAIIIVILLIVVYVVFKVLTSGSSDMSKGDTSVQWKYHMERAQKIQPDSKKQAFVTAFSSAGADVFLRDVDLPVLPLMALSAWETGWGLSHAALEHNNLWGISTDGVPRPYAGLTDSFDAMKGVMYLPRYAAALRVKYQPEAFIRALRAGGYNSDQSWEDGIIRLISEIRPLLRGSA